jgi:hypothetical protein
MALGPLQCSHSITGHRAGDPNWMAASVGGHGENTGNEKYAHRQKAKNQFGLLASM